MAQVKKRILSGIQPSGNLTIGNYVGAMKNWVTSQDTAENIFMIVDMHAITVPQDPKVLQAKIRELAALYLASGIDPEKSSIFVQSHVAAHAELAWILNCFTPMGWLERMTQFKDKSAKGGAERASVGLFDYPVLMAADILLYAPDEIPVGEDQKQHVELTRDIAQRMNGQYGELFKIPKAVIPQVGARVMGLDDPTKKMSKSEASQWHAIYLTDKPDTIIKKVKKATTDSENVVAFDENRPGVYNLLSLYELFSGKSRADIETHFADTGYGDFKTEVGEIIVEGLRPMQEKYNALQADPSYLESILTQGKNQVEPIAQETLARVKNAVGLG